MATHEFISNSKILLMMNKRLLTKHCDLSLEEGGDKLYRPEPLVKL